MEPLLLPEERPAVAGDGGAEEAGGEAEMEQPLLSKSRQPLHPWSRTHVALDLTNAFVADAASLGALAFIYCTSSEETGGLGMSTSVAGAILMVQGIFGVIAGPPAGFYIDRSRQKKQILSLICALIAVSWLLLAAFRNHVLVAILLSLQGLAGAVFPPGLCGLSLGVVGYGGFPARAARNEQWKHAGAVVGALSPIALVNGNYTPLFIVYAGAMLCAILSIHMIRDRDIDHDLASGLKKGTSVDKKEQVAQVIPVSDFLRQPKVLIFLGMVVLWHFANAAMLPSVGYKIQQQYESDPENAEHIVIGKHRLPLDGKNGISLATVVAHIIMIPVAKVSGILASLEWAGSKWTLTWATSMIVLRGIAFALLSDAWALLGVCFLDGLSAGAFGVLAILMVGDLAVGTGRSNLLQGAMAACIGAGASISNGVFGAVTESNGVDTTFWSLAAIGCVALAILIWCVDDLHDYVATGNPENTTFWNSPTRCSTSVKGTVTQNTMNPVFCQLPNEELHTRASNVCEYTRDCDYVGLGTDM